MHRLSCIIAAIVLAGASSTARAATYVVTNTNDAGAGSLRQAIVNANANPGTDFIEFNIPGAGPHLILPASPLPIVSGTTSINGSTQPGFSGIPLIEIGGDFAGATTDGLWILNNSSQVGWLTINGFGGNGIRISGTGNATVVGCYIGVDNDGGGVTYPNGGHGVFIDNSPNNDIGGTTAALRNVIAGNMAAGVRIEGPAATGNIVAGNYVGLDRTGTVGLGNDFHGIYLVDCDGNTIGGASTAARNVVAFNGPNNIRVQDCNSAGNTVQNNRVGTNAAGTAVVGGGDGIVIIRSRNCVVRGNLASGNQPYNIDVGTFSEGTVVQGNIIGANAAGTAALGGGNFAGLSLFNVCSITVGGSSASDRNVISGNAGEGIYIWGSSSFECATADVVQGNYIGVGADGTTPIGNGGSGVAVSRPSNIRIGGFAAGEANVIAHNAGPGVLVTNSSFSGVPAHRVQIRRNSIHSNGGLGIDLSALPNEPDGVTPNDHLDPDTGANDFQNFPVLTSAESDGATLRVEGSINSNPFQSFSFDLYVSPDCDPSGHGEGRQFVNSFGTSTGSNGVTNFVYTHPIDVPLDWFVTITATNTTTGDTSEFSPCVPLSSAACAPDAGSCYTPDGTPGCASGTDCCDIVCDVDPYCCETEWDEICVNEATLLCAQCGTETAGDCFTPNGSTGCYDAECCATVCDLDPYCCDTEWDAICAATALKVCTLPCPGDVPFISPGVVDVQDLLFLLGAWGETGPPRPRADVAPPPTGDNVVNVVDLLEILANWGSCG